jgi:hypothetical protein
MSLYWTGGDGTFAALYGGWFSVATTVTMIAAFALAIIALSMLLAMAGWSRSTRRVAFVGVVAASVAWFLLPIYGIYIACYIGSDCI